MTTNPTEPFTKIQLLEKQIAEEVKEKYALYKRISELVKEVNKLKKSEKSPLLFGKTVIEYIYKMKKAEKLKCN